MTSEQPSLPVFPSDLMERCVAIGDRMRGIITPEGFVKWWGTPIRALDGTTPAKMALIDLPRLEAHVETYFDPSFS